MSGAAAAMLLGTGGKDIVQVGVSFAGSSGTSLNIAKPSGVQAGDLLVALITCNDGSSWAGDTGWTERKDVAGWRVATKTATGSEPSSYAFANSGSSFTHSGGVVIAYRNAAFDVVGNVLIDSAGHTNVAPSITLSAKGLLLAAFAVDQAPRTMTTPSGMTTVYVDNNSTVPSLAVFSQSVGAGATGTRSSSPGGGGVSAGVLVGLKAT